MVALTSSGVGWLPAYTGSHTGKWSQALGEKDLRIPPGGSRELRLSPSCSPGPACRPYLGAAQLHPSGAQRSPRVLGWMEGDTLAPGST